MPPRNTFKPVASKVRGYHMDAVSGTLTRGRLVVPVARPAASLPHPMPEELPMPAASKRPHAASSDTAASFTASASADRTPTASTTVSADTVTVTYKRLRVDGGGGTSKSRDTRATKDSQHQGWDSLFEEALFPGMLAWHGRRHRTPPVAVCCMCSPAPVRVNDAVLYNCRDCCGEESDLK